MYLFSLLSLSSRFFLICFLLLVNAVASFETLLTVVEFLSWPIITTSFLRYIVLKQRDIKSIVGTGPGYQAVLGICCDLMILLLFVLAGAMFQSLVYFTVMSASAVRLLFIPVSE